MANLFNSVKGLHPKRNAFSAHSYRNDYTCRIGQLVPVYIEHTVPGTSVHLSVNALARLQALISPIMDNVDYYIHFWQIPYRLLENGKFTQFVGGEMDEADYNPPYITGKSVYLSLHQGQWDELMDNGSLLDMLGYDKYYFASQSEVKVNIRPIQAYAFLLLHWYVNEHIMPHFDFQDDVEALLAAEGDATHEVTTFLENLATSMGTFFNHGWTKDYFTSALPNVQDGSPVSLSLVGSAPVTGTATGNISIPEASLSIDEWGPYNTLTQLGIDSSGNLYGRDGDDIVRVQNAMNASIEGDLDDGYPLSVEGTADLSEASAITINELRVANALQIFKERIMRFGHRANEYYKGFFNVTPEDLRLQLPKYLGGGRIPINISDIEQTAPGASGQTPLATLAGKGTAVAGGFAGFNTFTSEESIIIGVAWLQPKQSWMNGMRRFMFKLNDRYDYFNPSFEHLGEQEIMNCEVWSGGNSNEFGYTPRFAEYRFHQNEVHGDFKGTLAYWNLSRKFTSQPALNASFIYMQPSAFDRVFAVEGASHALVSLKFDVRMVAPISRYGTPMLLA